MQQSEYCQINPLQQICEMYVFLFSPFRLPVIEYMVMLAYGTMLFGTTLLKAFFFSGQATTNDKIFGTFISDISKQLFILKPIFTGDVLSLHKLTLGIRGCN